MMYSIKKDNHLYVFRNGELVYKRWLNKDGNKTQPSLLYNTNGWMNEWIA